MQADPFQTAATSLPDSPPYLAVSSSDLCIDGGIVFLMSRRMQKCEKRREVNGFCHQFYSFPRLLRQSVPSSAAGCNYLLSGPITEVRASTVPQAVDSSCDPRVKRRCVLNKPINDVYIGSESRDECADAL